jgi:DNA-binding NtrC family response regulator
MVAELEKSVIKSELQKSGWNKSKAARNLGIHEATLRKKMKIHGIEKPRN